MNKTPEFPDRACTLRCSNKIQKDNLLLVWNGSMKKISVISAEILQKYNSYIYHPYKIKFQSFTLLFFFFFFLDGGKMRTERLNPSPQINLSDITVVRHLHSGWEREDWRNMSAGVIGLVWFLCLMAYQPLWVLWCWLKKDTGNTKGLIEKHLYSSNRNKIQVNLVKQ